jgi:hypothetical protein
MLSTSGPSTNIVQQHALEISAITNKTIVSITLDPIKNLTFVPE